MRILQIITMAGEMGGADFYVIRTSRLLRRRGHEIIYVTPDDWKVQERLVENSAVFHLNRARGFRTSRKAVKSLGKIIERCRPDLAVVNNTVGFFTSIVDKGLSEMLPVVRHVHDARVLCPRSLSKSLPVEAREDIPGLCERRAGPGCFTRGCFRDDRKRDLFTGPKFEQLNEIIIRLGSIRGLRRMHALIANSGYVKDELIKLGIDGNRIFVVGQTLPWPREDCGPKQHTRTKEPVIGVVGRWDHVKGLELLLDVLIDLAPSCSFKAQIAGGDAGLDAAVERVRDAGLDERIDIRGFVPPGDMPAFYRRIDFLVFPSLIPETFGLAGIEAQAFGAPVVGFDAGGVRDWLLHDRTGILVPFGDWKGLYDAIRNLAESPETRRRLGEQARNNAWKKYTVRPNIDRLETFFEGIIQQAGR